MATVVKDANLALNAFLLFKKNWQLAAKAVWTPGSLQNLTPSLSI